MATELSKLLKHFNEGIRLLDDFGRIPPERKWLGNSPATEGALQEAEARLETQLPPSYREFLLLADGFECISISFGRLLSSSEIGWLRDTDPACVKVWTETQDQDVSTEEHRANPTDSCRFRVSFLRDVLQISEDEDGGYYLLNPQVVDDNGEWEAWTFAHWYPGAFRFGSFGELLKSEAADLEKELRELKLTSRLQRSEQQVVDDATRRISDRLAEGSDVSAEVVAFIQENQYSGEFGDWVEKKGPKYVYDALYSSLTR